MPGELQGAAFFDADVEIAKGDREFRRGGIDREDAPAMELFKQLAAFFQILLNGAETNRRREIGDRNSGLRGNFLFAQAGHDHEVLAPHQGDSPFNPRVASSGNRYFARPSVRLSFVEVRTPFDTERVMTKVSA